MEKTEMKFSFEFDTWEDVLKWAGSVTGAAIAETAVEALDAATEEPKKTRKPRAPKAETAVSVPDPEPIPAEQPAPVAETAAPLTFPAESVAPVAFPASEPAAPAVDPEVLDLVKRISARADGSIASGQKVDAIVAWFQKETGAAGATMDQIKQVHLPKLPVEQLRNIAKLVNA